MSMIIMTVVVGEVGENREDELSFSLPPILLSRTQYSDTCYNWEVFPSSENHFFTSLPPSPFPL